MNHTLESSKLFPYIAWITVILFALLTYALAANLQTKLTGLERDVDALEAQVRAQ